MATTEWMLEPGPAFYQPRLQNSAQPEFACWAACAEMVIKWHNPNAWFGYPGFEMHLQTAWPNRAEYFGRVLENYGFKSQNDGGLGTWSVAAMASYLCWRGPLLARGRFMDVLASDNVHEIVVFGCKNGLVRYIDPMDATRKSVGITLFHQRLWRSHYAVLSHINNHRQELTEQQFQTEDIKEKRN